VDEMICIQHVHEYAPSRSHLASTHWIKVEMTSNDFGSSFNH